MKLIAEVAIQSLESWAIVTDDRLPEGYINDSPCFTGYYILPDPLMKFAIETYGWKELEE